MIVLLVGTTLQYRAIPRPQGSIHFSHSILTPENESIAEKAVGAVKVSYSDVKPPILTVKDAIDKKSFFPKPAEDLIVGDAESKSVPRLNERNKYIESFCLALYVSYFYIYKSALAAIAQSPVVIEGEMELGPQYHMSMETHVNVFSYRYLFLQLHAKIILHCISCQGVVVLRKTCKTCHLYISYEV